MKGRSSADAVDVEVCISANAEGQDDGAYNINISFHFDSTNAGSFERSLGAELSARWRNEPMISEEKLMPYVVETEGSLTRTVVRGETWTGKEVIELPSGMNKRPSSAAELNNCPEMFAAHSDALKPAPEELALEVQKQHPRGTVYDVLPAVQFGTTSSSTRQRHSSSLLEQTSRNVEAIEQVRTNTFRYSLLQLMNATRLIGGKVILLVISLYISRDEQGRGMISTAAFIVVPLRPLVWN